MAYLLGGVELTTLKPLPGRNQGRYADGDVAPEGGAPQVLPAYARRMRQVNATLLQVYLCGGNSRRIRGALRPLLQSRALSRSAISRIVQGLTAQVEAWQTRALAELDLVSLDLDGFYLRVRLGGRV